MIPYNTDAPLYHLPIATVSLIVLNTVLFLAVPTEWVSFEHTGQFVPVEVLPDSDQPTSSHAMLSLEYGEGLKPWQWLTSIFMHADILHLVFNMIALWAFGLVVEGKIGLTRFLAIYLGIGVSQSAIEQLVMCLYGHGGSLGASAAIFGILGVAMVWAPKNEFEVFYQFGFRMGTIEIPIMVYGLLQVAIEVFNVVIGQFGVSSGVLHLMGFAIGMTLGFVWLVRGWVDCEGWDLVTVWHGHEGRDFENERLEREAADLVNSSQRARSDTAVRVKQPLAKPQAQVQPKLPAPTKTAKASKTASPSPSDEEAPAAIPVVPMSMFAPPPPNADDFADLFAPTAAVEPESPEMQLIQLIETGKTQAAVRLLIKLRSGGAFELQQAHLAKLIRDLVATNDLNNAVPLMAEHIRRFTDNRTTLQVNLAKILLQKDKPQKALQVLKSIDRSSVPATTLESIAALTAHAESQVGRMAPDASH